MAWAFPPPYGRKPLDDRLAILRGGRCPDTVRLARLTGREAIALRGLGNDAPKVGAIDADTPQRTRACALLADP